MDLFPSIALRKSCRKYAAQPLGQSVLDEIDAAVAGFPRLYAGKSIGHRYVEKTKGNFGVAAPQYLIITGHGETGQAENAGFVYEHLGLWLNAKGLGSVWLGASKPVAPNPNGEDLLAIALGTPEEPASRDITGFKRKPIGEVTNAPEDPFIKAVHLAPSGMNLQPWFFEKDNGVVRVYRQKLRPPVSLLYKHTDVDMGIALCHYAVACAHYGKDFAFHRDETLPQRKGFDSFGVIE